MLNCNDGKISQQRGFPATCIAFTLVCPRLRRGESGLLAEILKSASFFSAETHFLGISLLSDTLSDRD